MPTAVLMMIGQIAVMKMTKIAEGWPSRNAASDSGSQASGGTVRSTWKIGSSRAWPRRWPTSTPSATPDDRRERIAERHALQAREQVPEQALVEAAVVVERIDDQLPGIGDHLGRRRRQAVGRAAEASQITMRRERDQRRTDAAIPRAQRSTRLFRDGPRAEGDHFAGA